MTISSKPVAPGTNVQGDAGTKQSSDTRFAEVLDKKKRQNAGEAPRAETRKTEETDETADPAKPKEESLEEKPRETFDVADIAMLMEAGPGLPFVRVTDVSAIATSPGAAVTPTETLLAGLVQEITVVAGEPAAVDIKFNSRTLEGLEVRVQKTPETVAIQFSTASESVSKLLTTNLDTLTQALAQRGFAQPAISIQQRTLETTTSSGKEFGRESRDGSSRGRQQHSGGQKRR